MKKSPIIELHAVSKSYQLSHNKPTFFESILGVRNNQRFTALDNLSLEVNPGQKVGLVGLNGAGKTTLLKVIAGITTPDSGMVKTRGRVVSLIDIEAGFHPDLTGRENIELNGLIIGMTSRQISQQEDQIIKFAGLEKFIDESLFTYSDGMKLRLGFSIALHAEPDILLLDESIAAGDKNFQQQSFAVLDEMIRQRPSLTIIMVTHVLFLIRKFCQRIVWLEEGKIIKDGKIKLLDKYEAQNNHYHED